MAYARIYPTPSCYYWRKYRSMAWYENLAPQDDAQEVQIWYTIDYFTSTWNTSVSIKSHTTMKTEEAIKIYTTISPACPCCCSAYMEEHETYWVCPVCGAVVDKR